MEKVLKLSEILSQIFTLFFTSEVYVALVQPYPSDRTINIKNLQVTQGPSCQPRAQLISRKSQMLPRNDLNTRMFLKVFENLSLKLCLTPEGAKIQ